MEEILQQLNAVQGVIGGLVCDTDGGVVATAFPSLFDQGIIGEVAAAVADRSAGAPAAGSFELLDLRYGDGRILVKPLQGGSLVLLCTKGINLPVLVVSLNMAKAKLETMLASASRSAEAQVAPAGAALLTLPVCHLEDRTVGSSFEQFGMAAITHPTSRQISSFYKTGTFKKLKLTCTATGASGIFPVMVVNENDAAYDGKIILCKAIERKLQAGPGDVLLVEL